MVWEGLSSQHIRQSLEPAVTLEQLRDAWMVISPPHFIERYAKLMHEHWMGKRSRTPGMSNRDIDGWYDAALRNGALGGKLVGAGAGGG